MKKRTVLPINENPSLITCIHHAYPCAIIESKELVHLYIENFANYKWERIINDKSINVDGECVTISEEDGAHETNSILWRECATKDEIILNIDYIKSTDFSRYIDVFLFKDDLEHEVKKEDKSCGVRWNKYGYFIQKEMYNFDTNIYTYLKLCIDEEGISGFASQDGEAWSYIERKSFPAQYRGCKLNLGIHSYFGKNCFNEWKNMNLIQLIYNKANPYKGIHLDYYFFPRKNIDNSYSYYINFLDTKYDLLHEILDCYESVHEFIQWSIRHLNWVDVQCRTYQS